jgi:hypothetical protein
MALTTDCTDDTDEYDEIFAGRKQAGQWYYIDRQGEYGSRAGLGRPARAVGAAPSSEPARDLFWSVMLCRILLLT